MGGVICEEGDAVRPTGVGRPLRERSWDSTALMARCTCAAKPGLAGRAWASGRAAPADTADPEAAVVDVADAADLPPAASGLAAPGADDDGEAEAVDCPADELSPEPADSCRAGTDGIAEAEM